MSCQWPECTEESSTSAAVIRNRKREELTYFCQMHANQYRDTWLTAPFSSRFISGDSRYVPFDIYLVFHNAERSTLWLREINGGRAIGFTTGPAEGYSLQARLGVDGPQVLSPHRAIVDAVQELGGSVRQIQVNDFVDSARYLVIKCALQLLHGTREVEVELKASDAFALAVESTAPLVVLEDLLRKLPVFKDDGRGGLFTRPSKTL